MPQSPPPDSVRAVLRKVFTAPEYRWRTHRSLADAFSYYWQSLMRFMDRMSTSHPAGFLALMLLLTLIVAVLFTHLAFVVRRALRQAPDTPADALSLPVVRDATWHLAQARRLAATGQFKEALGHRFLALVLQLERRQALDVHASRTPAEYARTVRLDEGGKQQFSALVGTLYAALFGGHGLDAAQFDEFDRQAAELMKHAPAR